MKYLKMLGLAAVAAMALMAFLGAGTASATKLYQTTSGGGSDPLGPGTTIHATLEGGTSSKLTTTAGTTLNTCTTSTVHGTTSNTGGATETVSGSVAATSLTWSNCSSGTVTTTVGGTLEVHHISGTTNGTLTASGFRVTVNTIFGPCTYESGEGRHMGTLTGAPSHTGHATMAINAIVTRVAEDPDSGTCPSSARWQGSYEVTTPTGLKVEAS